MVNFDIFICACCNQENPIDYKDDRAEKEASILFPKEKIEDMAMVCHSCFIKIMEFNNHPIDCQK